MMKLARTPIIFSVIRRQYKRSQARLLSAKGDPVSKRVRAFFECRDNKPQVRPSIAGGQTPAALLP
jgi:hypothetical protein